MFLSLFALWEKNPHYGRNNLIANKGGYMKKSLSVIIAAMMFMTACGTASSSSTEEKVPMELESSPVPSSSSNKSVTVGIIECPWVLGGSAFDAGYAETQFAANNPEVSLISCFAENKQQVLEYAQNLLLDDAKAILVSLPDSGTADDLIALCKEKGVPLIFSGAKPTQETMESYDKCWYIGMLCEQTGEVMGKAVAQDFKDGIIPDTNGDSLLQYAWFGGDNTGAGELHYQYCLQSCADMGVFSNEIFSQFTACGVDAGYAMAQNLLGVSIIGADSASQSGEIVDTAPVSYPTPEAVLCSDSATAEGAAPLLLEQNIYVACVAWSEAEAKSLEEKGIHAPVWFARDEATEYAVLFVDNLLNGRHVTLDTDLYLDEFRQTLVTAGKEK